MKKLANGAMIMLVLAALSCQKNQEGNSRPLTSVSETMKDTTETLYAVALELALKDMKRYDSVTKAKLGSDPIRAFTIRSVDLLEAMGMSPSDTVKTKFEHVRLYMGLNNTNDFKLFLTPVEGAKLDATPPVAGKDVILKGNIKMTATETGENPEEPYMLDFSQPCPKTCPEGN